MNKKYATEILEMVERKVLDANSSLAKEAFRYLKSLKKISREMYDRIHKIQYK